jgi:hypothetical protein
MKKHYRILSLAALLLAVCFIDAHSQDGKKRAPAPEPCPDARDWKGKYKNQYYGFSIIIPPGRRGYWNSARCVPDEKVGCVCMTDHGRSIPLSDEAAIEAFAGFERDPELTLADYERDEVSFIKGRKEAGQVSVLSSRRIRLGRVAARRFVVRLVERGASRIEDRIIALHDGVEYDLTLSTLEARYQEDRREFEKVVLSWRLIPRER